LITARVRFSKKNAPIKTDGIKKAIAKIPDDI
jgi:hypothetical protein